MSNMKLKFNKQSIRVNSTLIRGWWNVTKTEITFVTPKVIPSVVSELFHVTQVRDPDTHRPATHGLHIPCSYEGFDSLYEYLTKR